LGSRRVVIRVNPSRVLTALQCRGELGLTRALNKEKTIRNMLRARA